MILLFGGHLVINDCSLCSTLLLLLLNPHAEVESWCWSCRTRRTWRMSQSLCRSSDDSARRRSLSDWTRWQWWETNRNRFKSSRFPNRSRFTWFLKFSRCFCFRMRDRRADSRFEIMRLRLRSSTAGRETAWFGSGSSIPDSETGLVLFRLGSSEPEFEFTGFWFEFELSDSEPEFEITGS